MRTLFFLTTFFTQNAVSAPRIERGNSHHFSQNTLNVLRRQLTPEASQLTPSVLRNQLWTHSQLLCGHKLLLDDYAEPPESFWPTPTPEDIDRYEKPLLATLGRRAV